MKTRGWPPNVKKLMRNAGFIRADVPGEFQNHLLATMGLLDDEATPKQNSTYIVLILIALANATHSYRMGRSLIFGPPTDPCEQDMYLDMMERLATAIIEYGTDTNS